MYVCISAKTTKESMLYDEGSLEGVGTVGWGRENRRKETGKKRENQKTLHLCKIINMHMGVRIL